MVVFLVVILGDLKFEEEFLSNLGPFSQRFVILACCHPLIIVLIVRILSPIRSNSRVFSVCYPESINSGLFIPVFSSHSLNLTGASFKYSTISSRSLRDHGSKFTQVSSSHLLIISGDLYFCFFLEQFL